MRQILLAFDKFKGSLTARQASEAAAKGVSRALPRAKCVLRPVADGGEGTVEAVHSSIEGTLHRISVPNATGTREVLASFLIAPWEGALTGFLEMAQASGLIHLKDNERDPLIASTKGTGIMMKQALKLGATRLVLGLGGSATNDGGVGIAEACGFQFLDRQRNPVASLPHRLRDIAHIVPPSTRLGIDELIILTDVYNPLLGPGGATAVYGPQKGVTAETAAILEAGLTHLADLATATFGTDYRKTPGAGAAGGCAFGLMSFLDGHIEPGFSFICRLICLEEAVHDADLIIVGEGKLDAQTLCGKAPHGVARLAKKYGKPIAAIGGTIDPQAQSELAEWFDPILSLVSDEVTLESALRSPAHWLEERAFGLIQHRFFSASGN